MTYGRYIDIVKKWPDSGNHILASHTEDDICVYQAFNAEIADFVVKNGEFGTGFSFSRMTWIKPNFLWMMYRSGWALKTGQERVLEITLRKQFFEHILEEAVESSHGDKGGPSYNEWRLKLEKSEVRLQWDPDHDPIGKPLRRKAIQLGLRGSILRQYATRELRSVRDISRFVNEQRDFALSGSADLLVPDESVFIPSSRLAISNINL